MRQKTETKATSSVISTRLAPSLDRQFKRIARQEDRTVSWLARMAIRQFIETRIDGKRAKA